MHVLFQVRDNLTNIANRSGTTECLTIFTPDKTLRISFSGFVKEYRVLGNQDSFIYIDFLGYTTEVKDNFFHVDSQINLRCRCF